MNDEQNTESNASHTPFRQLTVKQFSIRDMLLLFVIVALALGWLFDRRQVPARFQMHVTVNHAFVLDTATGQVWEGRVDERGNLYKGDPLKAAKVPK